MLRFVASLDIESTTILIDYNLNIVERYQLSNIYILLLLLCIYVATKLNLDHDRELQSELDIDKCFRRRVDN